MIHRTSVLRIMLFATLLTLPRRPSSASRLWRIVDACAEPGVKRRHLSRKAAGQIRSKAAGQKNTNRANAAGSGDRPVGKLTPLSALHIN